ncbi:hypothetical protein D3C75_520550 [compost metagenome]
MPALLWVSVLVCVGPLRPEGRNIHAGMVRIRSARCSQLYGRQPVDDLEHLGDFCSSTLVVLHPLPDGIAAQVTVHTAPVRGCCYMLLYAVRAGKPVVMPNNNPIRVTGCADDAYRFPPVCRIRRNSKARHRRLVIVHINQELRHVAAVPYRVYHPMLQLVGAALVEGETQRGAAAVIRFRPIRCSYLPIVRKMFVILTVQISATTCVAVDLVDQNLLLPVYGRCRDMVQHRKGFGFASRLSLGIGGLQRNEPIGGHGILAQPSVDNPEGRVLGIG